MYCVASSLCYSQVAYLLVIIATVLGSSIIRVECLNFSYPIFPEKYKGNFSTTENSAIASDAIHVTREHYGAAPKNLSGRVWHKKPFKLHSRSKNITASFNSTFVLNIAKETEPGGEGIAFILTKESGYASIPDNSKGQWLGIVNASTNGSDASSIVAIEFDTKQNSYLEDIDDNHVGVDVNSVYSMKQVSLNGHGVYLSRGIDVTASVQYDGESKNLTVFVFMTANETRDSMKEPIISMNLDLSSHLPEDVFVGFSASTGEGTQRNCIKSWNFTSTVIDDDDAVNPKDTDDDEVNLLWVWISVSVVPVVLLTGFFLYLYLKRKSKEKQLQDEDSKVDQQIQSSANAPQKFRLKELKQATGYFNSKNQLGKGGFGTVYKGLLDSKEVAVKRFSNDSREGKQDFIAEVTIIGSLHHKNLVKLVGWCYERNELILVYEFMPNGSLDKLIFCNKNQYMASTLSWERRYGIICGVARALDYLHNGCEKRVLHRDIKASNIMLDSEFNARLGDFGLARTIQLSEKTHHSTKEIAGTLGYMAPESFHIGRATVETDVYAFGVLLLEVVCGRKPENQNGQNDYNNKIVDWVWELYRMVRIIDAVDIQLNGEFEEDQVECVLELGLACCHPNPYQRPSMRTALQVLTGEAAPPSIPSEKPIFMWPVVTPSFKESLDCSVSEDQLSQITVLSGR
uniref:Putative L-type lectin-domain containing receptor kinase S.5 n=1 Tax=Davidia involucrata TaxID=16924 RepID=A0A5B7ASF7_DAVIN